ncbi:MAG: murein transglycosylase [Alphaproteobacteria bacterium]|nr:murein transglycosylase [Alphaproteobacteria bacterium]
MTGAGVWLLWPRPVPVTPPPEERLSLAPASYGMLPGWADDDQAAALAAFRRSCRTMLAQPPDRPLDGDGFAGAIGDWQPACRAASDLPEAADAAMARHFFETWFQPLAVANGDDARGLFTGYYAPIVHGSRTRTAKYDVPLYRAPPELVMVDLGQFRPSLKGQRIAGKVEGNRLVPFASRAEIVNGALSRRGLEIMWLDDPVDAFFMQIQGSGLVRLPDGSLVRLGFAGQNGYPYTSVGKLLVQRGEMTLDQASMQSIRAWVNAHPEEGRELLNENRSYVFFEEQNAEGAVGAQGVVLTPGRSLAVDRKFMPLGAPIWLDVTSDDGVRHLQRLVVAQDTGGAITGIVRGDFYWGEGDAAEKAAGPMKDRGRYFILLPRPVAARALAASPAGGAP